MPLYVLTTTFFVTRSTLTGEQEPQTVIYSCLAADKVIPVLTNAYISKTFDMLVMCIDALNFVNSCAYVKSLYNSVIAKNNSRSGNIKDASTSCADMPVILLLTKADSEVMYTDDGTNLECTAV
uniref:Uncharacterized protein n=1 Tax=Lygus hesperus TaxID=30085 RepID=A0A146LFE6_LYGHE